ncbi:MAG: efflux RND transporter periplasmic adaptor subunit, partial [Candidatus Margulisiibacteriota bacterium]
PRVQATQLTFAPLTKTICLTGTVEYQSIIRLTAPVPSKISKLLVKANDSVSVNQPLLILSSETLEQEINDLKQQLDLAEANYRQAFDRLSLDHRKKFIQYEKLRAAWQDSQELQKSGAISQKELNQIQIEFKQTELDYDYIKTQLTNFKTKSSEAMKEQGLRRTLTEKKALRKHLTVLAPVRGKIIEIGSEETHLAKDQEILEMIDPSKMIVKAQANEYEVPYLSVNEDVLLKFPSLPDILTSSSILEISRVPLLEGASSVYPVSVAMPSKVINDSIFSGILVEIWASYKSSGATWSLPVSAVAKNTKGDYIVYGIDEHKRLHTVQVLLGLHSLDRVQIRNRESLKTYAHFVNDANQLLADGQKVRF